MADARSPLTRALFWLAVALLGVALAGLWSPAPARWLGAGTLAWIADLASHWVWLWLPLGALGVLLLRWRWPLRALLAAALIVPPWLFLPSALPEGAGAAQLRIVSANVHLSATDPSRLLDWLRADEPDVVVLHELRAEYAQRVSALPSWPHVHLAPRGDSFGIGVLSRWPLRDVRLLADGAGLPRLQATVAAPMGAFDLIAVHPMPPLSPRWHRLRDEMLGGLAADGDRPTLVVGDFNATPWSSAAAVMQRGGWRWFGGVQPTWPHAWWGIPIDAVWARGPWQVLRREVGPPIGSDHRPLRVDLRLAAP
jgi:endonuclease/exonuclease/phosphatase (EEP) superfamily protein YafD